MAFLSFLQRNNGSLSAAEMPEYAAALRNDMLPTERQQLQQAKQSLQACALRVMDQASAFRQRIQALEGEDSVATSFVLDGALADVLRRAEKADINEAPQVAADLETLIKTLRAEYEALVGLGAHVQPIEAALGAAVHSLDHCESRITHLYDQLNALPVHKGVVAGSDRQRIALEQRENRESTSLLEKIGSAETFAREHSKLGFAAVHVQSNGRHLPLREAATLLRQEAATPAIPRPDLLTEEFSRLQSQVVASKAEEASRNIRMEKERRMATLREHASKASKVLDEGCAPLMERCSQIFDEVTATLRKSTPPGEPMDEAAHLHFRRLEFQDYKLRNLGASTKMTNRILEMLPEDFNDLSDILELLQADYEHALERAKERAFGLRDEILQKRKHLIRDPHFRMDCDKYDEKRRDMSTTLCVAEEKLSIVHTMLKAARWASPIRAAQRWWRKRNDPKPTPHSTVPGNHIGNGKPKRKEKKRSKGRRS